jgi:hypothetical protein
MSFDGLEKEIKEAFEKGFGKILGPPPPKAALPLSHVTLDKLPKTEEESIKLLHHQCLGEGNTLVEAFDDFKTKLAEKPQSGQMLYWRVTPEIASQRDFAADKTRYRIYARFAVLP